MDSVTQFTLGAVVGTAVLGRRLGVRRAAITGGILGTLPDLDVYLPADDPIESFVGHRGWSHSLIVHAVVTPLIAEGLVWMFAALRQARYLTWLAVMLCLATHALIDAMTVYGTRLFWPVWPEPLGAGSIFIIDPLYTLPLLVTMLWAFCRREWSPRFGKVLTVSLVISTAYLGWTLIGQRIAEVRGVDFLTARGIEPERLLAGPTPLNSLFWRVIAVDGHDYYHVYVPILGDAASVTAYRHARWESGLICWAKRATAGDGLAGVIARFSDGFYQVTSHGEAVLVSDLRMGIYPNYVFQFAVAAREGGKIVDTSPSRVRGERRQIGDLEWLAAGMRGAKAVRPAEADLILTDPPANLATADRQTNAC